MSIRGRLLALAIGGVLPLLTVGLTVLWVVLSEKQNQLNDALEQQAELAVVQQHAAKPQTEARHTHGTQKQTGAMRLGITQ